MAESVTSIRGRILRQTIARFTSDHLIGKKIQTGELRKKLVETSWHCPDGFSFERLEMTNFSMYYLVPEENNGKAILQLHGGGYIAGIRNAYHTWSCMYSELAGDCSVLTPDYRVAPENPYPAALEDAAVSYEWLLEQGFRPSDIVLVGDSAGGGLAMALCHYLRDQGQELPAGMIAMSPWTDLTLSGESYVLNYENDPLFGNTRESMIYNRDYIGMHDPKNPYLSPLFGDFSDFPPMLIQVGSLEMLLSDSIGVAARMKEQKSKVRLSVYEGMFHEFQMAGRLLPESKRAWAEIAEYFKAIAF